MELRIEGVVVTDAGNVRSKNEDNFYLFGEYRHDTSVNTGSESKNSPADRGLAAVFDGMGGEDAGEVASLIAAGYFTPCEGKNVQDEIKYQVMGANREICRVIEKRGSRIGTTAVLLYLNDGKAVCCNVGDSRCYILRDATLRQMSVDHTEASNKIRLGILNSEDARTSRDRHRLTQHLGIFPDEFVIEPHFSDEIELQIGDVFLLCSDGLTDMVTDNEIAGILGQVQDVRRAAEMLLEAALKNGGRDNVTIMVLRVC